MGCPVCRGACGRACRDRSCRPCPASPSPCGRAHAQNLSSCGRSLQHTDSQTLADSTAKVPLRLLTFAPGVAGKIRGCGPISGFLLPRTRLRARGLRPRDQSAAPMVRPQDYDCQLRDTPIAGFLSAPQHQVVIRCERNCYPASFELTDNTGRPLHGVRRCGCQQSQRMSGDQCPHSGHELPGDTRRRARTAEFQRLPPAT